MIGRHVEDITPLKINVPQRELDRCRNCIKSEGEWMKTYDFYSEKNMK